MVSGGGVCMPTPDVWVATWMLRVEPLEEDIRPGRQAQVVPSSGAGGAGIRRAGTDVSQAMQCHSTLQHLFTLPLSPTPNALIVTDAATSATSEVQAQHVGDMSGLAFGDCKGRESEVTVPHLCHVVGITYPCLHGWHRVQQL